MMKTKYKVKCEEKGRCMCSSCHEEKWTERCDSLAEMVNYVKSLNRRAYDYVVIAIDVNDEGWKKSRDMNEDEEHILDKAIELYDLRKKTEAKEKKEKGLEEREKAEYDKYVKLKKKFEGK